MQLRIEPWSFRIQVGHSYHWTHSRGPSEFAPLDPRQRSGSKSAYYSQARGLSRLQLSFSLSQSDIFPSLPKLTFLPTLSAPLDPRQRSGSKSAYYSQARGLSRLQPSFSLSQSDIFPSLPKLMFLPTLSSE